MIKTVEIKIGEIFEVDGKMYVITYPKSDTHDRNEHGQVVSLLTEIE